MTRLRVGTSGYSYPEWVGPFYPEDLPKDRWLSYYAGRLGAVEINNSFYRVPRSAVVEGWAAAVPEDFRIVLKVTRRVTHFTRLKETADEPMHWMARAARKLGDRRGPLLFQLPPNFKADPERLRAFLERLDDDLCPAFEFRHASWQDEEIQEILSRAGAALCLADEEGEPPPELPRTVDFGYLRLRRPAYSEAELDAWCDRIRAAGWAEAYVFFKHEDEGAGPRLAEAFRERFEAGA